jgi:hypothetical protein
MRKHKLSRVFGCVVFWQNTNKEARGSFPGHQAARTPELSFRLSTNVHLPNDHQETIA